MAYQSCLSANLKDAQYHLCCTSTYSSFKDALFIKIFEVQKVIVSIILATVWFASLFWSRIGLPGLLGRCQPPAQGFCSDLKMLGLQYYRTRWQQGVLAWTVTPSQSVLVRGSVMVLPSWQTFCCIVWSTSCNEIISSEPNLIAETLLKTVDLDQVMKLTVGLH